MHCRNNMEASQIDHPKCASPKLSQKYRPYKKFSSPGNIVSRPDSVQKKVSGQETNKIVMRETIVLSQVIYTVSLSVQEDPEDSVATMNYLVPTGQFH